MFEARVIRESLGTVELAVDTKEDQSLPYLDLPTPGDTLRGLSLAIIGAGPAGLIAARSAAALSAHVVVLDKGGDPCADDVLYTDRSFNITLDNVGRDVLGNPEAFGGGIWLEGRAVHHDSLVKYGAYGHSSAAQLISIPRLRLRQNLATQAEAAGAELRFGARVVTADPESGHLTYETASGRLISVRADLIVFSDGLHSLADQQLGAGLHVVPEPKNYITGLISSARTGNLSLRHIHFWHETSGNYTVGIPNADKSISLLLVSPFHDVPSFAHPFPSADLSVARLRRDFPNVYADAPELPFHLPHRRRGRFCYKSVGRHVLGSRGVIVGDAACTVPPWAGYGANTAMYTASALISLLARHPSDPAAALAVYSTHVAALSTGLMSFVFDQGDFLAGPVTKDPAGRSDDALARLILASRTAAQVEAGAWEGEAVTGSAPSLA
jgi:kynurenine 3-monooxygenase